MDIVVVIEGVTDVVIERAIQKSIRKFGRSVMRAGEWRVTVFPSETRGEWDLGLQGPSERHFSSFVVPPDRLPDLIEGKLSEFLGIMP
jgi:hypothetical protein